jgi:hypothetical protein
MLLAVAATAAIAAAAIVAAGGIVTATGDGVGPAVRATVAPIPAAVRVVAPPRAARPSRTQRRTQRLVRQARLRYGQEVYGKAAHQQLRLIAHDPQLRAALRSGDLVRLRAYVHREFTAVWYHRHVSRLRLVRGAQVLAQAGVPFAVAGPHTALRGAHGRVLATLEVSIQDEIGYVRYMQRNLGIQSVVRGQGSGHVRSSLPAAARMTLPAHGTVTMSGRRYIVGSFHQKAFGGEPITVWVLRSA